MSARSRRLGVETKAGSASSQITGGATTVYDMTIRLAGFELTVDDDEHRWPPRGPLGNYGGFFNSKKVFYSDNSQFVASTWKSGIRNFQMAGFYPAYSKTLESGQAELPQGLSANDMTFYGTKGWSKASPTKPLNDFAVSIGELREGVPILSSLLRLKNQAKIISQAAQSGRLVSLGSSGSAARREAAKLAASGYLTYEFDFKPTLSDIRSLCSLSQKAEEHYEKIVAQGSKGTRRRRTLLSTRNVSFRSSQLYGYGVVLPTQAYSKKGLWSETIVDELNVWFSGSFRWPPMKYTDTTFGRTRELYQRLQYLYGLEVNPRSLYQLTPWSWLLDWFSNVGTVVSNVTDMTTTGLVSSYAYVMAHTKQVTTWSLNGVQLSDPSQTVINSSTTQIKDCKQRVGASPFGFAFQPESLSQRQLAILLALGISRDLI